jgi:UDP-N-acetylmuramate--alanine ligase
MQHIHFIGVGGAGMSGIAQVLIEMGCEVSGSDLKESRNTERLKSNGARIEIGHRADNIGDADVVVISSAIPAKNPELLFAREQEVPVLLRAEMLARLCDGKKSIAVAGTHGKTTTTSMIARMIKAAGLDPTFLIGGELNDVGGNAKHGKGDYLVAEADESDKSFLHLDPYIVVLTNIEADHLECYGSIEQIEKVFRQFLAKVPDEGFIVACGDYPNLSRLMDSMDRKFVTYGMNEDNDYYAKELTFDSLNSSFEVYSGNKLLTKAHLSVPGIHNIYNALAAFALGGSLDLEVEQIVESLGSFNGVQRRFQFKGESSRVTVVDDYAHHPTELKATLEAAKRGPWERIICVFQPHRFSRTKFLGSDFKDAFDDADLAILTDIYAAGEPPVPGVTGKILVEAILQDNPRKSVIYIPRKNEILNFLAGNLKDGDLVLTAGAGDIWTVGEGLLNMLDSDQAKVCRT